MYSDKFRQKLDLKLTYFSLLLVSIIFLFGFHYVDALIQTNNYNNGSATGWNGHISAEKFTNLPVGGTINQLSLNVSASVGHVRAKIYQDNGQIATHTSLHNNNAATSTVGGGNEMWLEKFSGLPAGANVTSIQQSTVSGANGEVKLYDDSGVFIHEASNQTCPIGCGVASTLGSGDIWLGKITGLPVGHTITGVSIGSVSGFGIIKTYVDDAGSHGGTVGFPYTEIGESSIVPAVGKQELNLGKIPASGNVWFGMQWNTTEHPLFKSATGTLHCTASFGVGPNPMPIGQCSDLSIELNFAIFYNDKNGTGMAGNLISSSNSAVLGPAPQSTNLNNGGIVPSDGNVWALFNIDTSNIATLYTNGASPIAFLFGQNEGVAGPTTFPPWYVTANQSLLVPYMGVTWKTNGGAGTLLGESNSITVNSTGQQNFPLIATIPTSGTVWGTFETDNAGLGLRELTKALTGLIYNYTHVYGIGPNPISGDSNSTHPAWMQISFVNQTFTIQLKPMLHDNSTQLTSAKITNKNGTTSQTITANSTGWVTFTGLSGNQNFTVFDDKNFAVLKIINQNVIASFSKNLATNDYPFNCIGLHSGYQSDFILRINDTDGTHITNITTPTCPNQNQLKFNFTFTGNGQSSSIYSSSMLTTVANQVYTANPKNFTASGTVVPTILTGGNNILSNSFTVGPGTSTTIMPFVINLSTTQSLSTGSAGSPNLNPNPVPTNQCPPNYEFDSISQQCIIINTGTLPVSSTICDPNRVAQGFLNINGVCTSPTNVISLPVDCGGGSSVTIVNVIVPPEAYFQQIFNYPFQYACPSQNVNIPILTTPPTTCLPGQSLQNDGTCAFTIAPIPDTCPTDPISCLIVTPPTEKLQVTVEKADGTTSVITLPLPALQSPTLTYLAWLIIFVILFSVIGGYMYRKFTKPKRKPRRRANGNSDHIGNYNKELYRKYK